MPNCKGGRGVEENAAGGKLSRFLKMGEGCFIHHQPFMWHISSQVTEMVWCKSFFFFFLKLVHWWRFYVFGQVKILRCYGSTSLIEYLQLRALWTEQEDADSGKKLTLVYKMSCRFGAACYWLKMEDFRDL